MTEPTPPPDEPLPVQARARIRAELLEAAQAAPPARRWLVPGAVAAAVVLVAGVAAWAVQAGGADPAPDDSAPAASVLTPSARPVDPTPSGPPSPTGVHQVGRGSCSQELRNPLPGAELAATFDDHTSMWVAGDRFSLCDVRDGVTTVHWPLPTTPAERAGTYAVSTSNDVQVAGGVVPEGATAFEVSYTFADGETVPAETVRGPDGSTWWRVVHPLSGRAWVPIDVTVSYSGVQEHYRLGDTDVCAQANHGC